MNTIASLIDEYLNCQTKKQFVTRELEDHLIKILRQDGYWKQDGYRSFAETIETLVQQGFFSPIKASGLNGLQPPLYERYRIIVKKDGFDQATRQKLLTWYHPQINTAHYLTHFKDYQEDEPYLAMLDSFLKQHKDFASWPMITANERSFQIFHNEKWLLSSHGRLFCQRVGLSLNALRCYQAEMAGKAEWQKETLDAYESAMEKMPEEIRRLWAEVTPYTDKEWVSLNIKPRRYLARMENERIDSASGIDKQKNVVRQRFERYLAKLEATNNVKVRQFIRDVRAIMAENRIYDYDFVQDQFLRIFEGLDRYETQYNNTLVECEKNKGYLVDLCLRRAGSVYDSIIEIPKNSRVRIYDRDVQVIRLDWPRREGGESGERMNQYIEQALEDLQVWKQQGKNDDEINRMIETKLKTRNLIEQIAPLENCRVTVYKPRKESMIRYGKHEYAPWDEVPKWSGGEEYSVYVTMFMIMLTHIRQQSEGRRNVWKVLLADNPFGKASSPHVWEPVFQIARANRIQLVCLTAHKQEDILKRFPVVYSLQLRSAYGNEIMRAELMESGFYRLDTAFGDGAQMMLLV